MAEARSCQLWDHTSEVLAMLANGLFIRKQPALARHYHPHRQKKQQGPVTPEEKRESFQVLRELFTNGSQRRSH